MEILNIRVILDLIHKSNDRRVFYRVLFPEMHYFIYKVWVDLSMSERLCNYHNIFGSKLNTYFPVEYTLHHHVSSHLSLFNGAFKSRNCNMVVELTVMSARMPCVHMEGHSKV